jgi:hypothetical protein
MKASRWLWCALLVSGPLPLAAADANGPHVESWLGRHGAAVGMAGYAAGDGRQYLFIAGSDGLVRPLVLSGPRWEWAWRSPVMRPHDGIVGVAAYFHPGDSRHHCFVALQSGDIWEASFASPDDPSSRSERWIGKLGRGAAGLAGFSMADHGQQLFVAGRNGLVYPLEIGPATRWQWAWRPPATSFHAGIVGMSAYYRPSDQARHVFVALESGEVWEALAQVGGPWKENGLGILDGGAARLAGHSASDGLQHLFVAGVTGRVLPLQIGPPHWVWRWDSSVMSRHEGIVGMAAYANAGDGRLHVIAVLRTGDVWESRFEPRSKVATAEWQPSEFPISYWFGPPDLADSPAKYQLIAGAGFTFALPPGDRSMDPSGNRTVLAAAGRAGLRMFISDSRIDALARGTRSRLDGVARRTLDAVIADYSGHSALAGYFLADEPADARLPMLAELVAYFRQRDPGHGCYINVLPSHAGAGAQYLEGYLNLVKPFVLSFDHYSLLANGTDEPSFFDNLHIVREKSIEQGLPFWQIILALQHGGYREPTAAEKRYEAMQVLAFGGKGILYFTYWQPGHPAFGPAIVNAAGTPTSHYDDVRWINADIRTMGRHLLEAQSTLVFENGVLPMGGTPPPAHAPVRMSDAANVTVGLFSKGQQEYALLASRDYRGLVSSLVRFQAQFLQRLDRANDSWISLDPSIEIRVDLAPGDAELFRFVRTPGAP